MEALPFETLLLGLEKARYHLLGARQAQNARMREEAYAFPTPEEAATTLNCGAPEKKIFAAITSSPISGIVSRPMRSFVTQSAITSMTSEWALLGHCVALPH